MRILLVEDDRSLSRLLDTYLSHYFNVDAVSTTDEAIDHIDQLGYDVVLLDRDLDGKDVGMELIKTIKTKDATTGIIVISAYDTIADKIRGLNLGADDYLDKPFDNDELLARIHALTRRYHSLPTVTIGRLECNTLTKTIKQGDKAVTLSKKESELFFHLLRKKGTIVSKEELLDAIYLNPQNISSNTIDVTIANIRRKLPQNVIKTVKTRGYIIA